MANEIDLYKDLEYCEKALKITKGDDLCHNAWLKERTKIVKKIKTNYPDLVWGNN